MSCNVFCGTLNLTVSYLCFSVASLYSSSDVDVWASCEDVCLLCCRTLTSVVSVVDSDSQVSWVECSWVELSWVWFSWVEFGLVECQARIAKGGWSSRTTPADCLSANILNIVRLWNRINKNRVHLLCSWVRFSSVRFSSVQLSLVQLSSVQFISVQFSLVRLSSV